MSILNYEFSDMYMPKVLNANETAVCLEVKELPWVGLDKSDVIALAKHFKLTSEDLL
mgnify:FL=1|tara:strand:+ start:383 stop:553 length:171 start_codon:yes stop_codon:yes gene_type:complete